MWASFTIAHITIPRHRTGSAASSLDTLAVGQTPALGAPDGAGQPGESILIETNSNRDEFMEALLARRDNGPERKLQKMIEFDENHAATVLKQWIRQGANG